MEVPSRFPEAKKETRGGHKRDPALTLLKWNDVRQLSLCPVVANNIQAPVAADPSGAVGTTFPRIACAKLDSFGLMLISFRCGARNRNPRRGPSAGPAHLTPDKAAVSRRFGTVTFSLTTRSTNSSSSLPLRPRCFYCITRSSIWGICDTAREAQATQTEQHAQSSAVTCAHCMLRASASRGLTNLTIHH